MLEGPIIGVTFRLCHNDWAVRVINVQGYMDSNSCMKRKLLVHKPTV